MVFMIESAESITWPCREKCDRMGVQALHREAQDQ